MISVVIPAHNEANVIGRLLQGLLDGARPDELEILVVCNGCTDDTAAVARGFGEPVTVLETPVASKSKALNLGDSNARGFPRFYIDADVIVSLSTLRRVAAVLREGQALVAAPAIRLNLKDCSWGVRAYYDIWMCFPYATTGMVGSGFYGVSQAGRNRFPSFPDIIADDGYVQLQFSEGERATVPACHFEIAPPRRLSDLINVKTRVQFGKYQLFALYPEMQDNDPRAYGRTFRYLMRRPQRWPALAVYCLVQYLARVRGRHRFRTAGETSWERDESSRASRGLPPEFAPRPNQDGRAGATRRSRPRRRASG